MEYIKRQNLDVVLVGDSGAGKSTIFQILCYQPLDSSPSSPIAPHDASKQGTLGVNYYVKEITGHDMKTTAKITLWYFWCLMWEIFELSTSLMTG